MRPSHRIIANTGAQFIKTFISGLITLYSSRLILLSLGENDFGIYSLIAGIIVMLAFITNALSATTQRFVSYNHNNSNLTEIISNSVFLHFGIGLAAVIVFLAISPLLFNGFLNIAPERIYAAKFIYITVIASLFVTFITSPYKAVLIAHENIVYISIIDIIDACLKLLIALSLNYIDFNRLEYYGLMLLIIQLFNLFAISIYAFNKYRECKIPRLSHIKKIYLSNLTSFAGWNMYGLACNIGRTQGLSIVLNKFFGTTINAAYGIGIQLASYVNYMSESLLNAMRPQIIKAEGLHERARAFRLSIYASKFSFFLLSFVSIPSVFVMDQLLDIWLKNPPSEAALFSRMFLISGLVDSITIGLHIVNSAIGNLKKYMLIISTLKLSVLIIAIISLLCKFPLYLIAVIYIGIEFLTAILRVKVLQRDGLNGNLYYKSVFSKILPPAIICIVVNFLFSETLNIQGWMIVYLYIISSITYTVAIYFLGMSGDERKKTVAMLKRIIDSKISRK